MAVAVALALEDCRLPMRVQTVVHYPSLRPGYASMFAPNSTEVVPVYGDDSEGRSGKTRKTEGGRLSIAPVDRRLSVEPQPDSTGNVLLALVVKPDPAG